MDQAAGAVDFRGYAGVNGGQTQQRLPGYVTAYQYLAPGTYTIAVADRQGSRQRRPPRSTCLWSPATATWWPSLRKPGRSVEPLSSTRPKCRGWARHRRTRSASR
jgi:hypothetical protein